MTKSLGQRFPLPSGATCRYCGHRATGWDHVVPRSKGGRDRRTNLAPACSPCNLVKGDAPADKFRAWLRSEAGKEWVRIGPSLRSVRAGVASFAGKKSPKRLSCEEPAPKPKKVKPWKGEWPTHGWTPEAVEALGPRQSTPAPTVMSEGGER